MALVLLPVHTAMAVSLAPLFRLSGVMSQYDKLTPLYRQIAIKMVTQSHWRRKEIDSDPEKLEP
jgi:hypothetical protein